MKKTILNNKEDQCPVCESYDTKLCVENINCKERICNNCKCIWTITK